MDAIAEWTRSQQRVVELVEHLGAEAADRRVPACPEWTVRDLLSHMIGLDADVLAGDEPDDHNSDWTQRQVEERRGRDVATLLEEWRALTDDLRAWMAEHGTRPMGDVVIHEQDLRGALGRPGAQDTAGTAALRDRFAAALVAKVARQGLAPVALVAPDWRLGDPGSAGLVLAAGGFELARAVMSRRSAAQVSAWVTRGDVTPYLPLIGGLGPLPADDLTI